MNISTKITSFIRVLRPIFIQSKSTTRIGVRNLYSQSVLGIDGFLQVRGKVIAQLSNVSADFKERLNDCVQDDDTKSMVFTEDIKNMVHLAESDSDVELLTKMIKKFSKQNKSLRFGNYIFGPVIMRMFHHLNKPQEALECFKDPDLNDFFTQFKSYQILLDLLYENQMYADILEVFHSIQEKQIEGAKFSKDAVVLVMAACYKINTPESYDKAIKIWTNLMDVGHRPLRKAVSFCAALAVNQNQPQVAFEILSNVTDQNYVSVRNVKILALIKDNRIDDAMRLIKDVAQEDTVRREGNSAPLFADVYETMKAAVEAQGSIDAQVEFKTLSTYLLNDGIVSDLRLDQHLCQEIQAAVILDKRSPNFDWKPVKQQRYRNSNRNAYNRPGLFDMVE